MGKRKNAKEKKVKGAEKTRMKTEKKLDKKTKKLITGTGEKDVEALIAECQSQSRGRQEVVEEKCPPPSPRSNVTLTAHPDKDVLIMFGGEYFNGNKTFIYNDLYLFHTKTSEWSKVTAPNTPAPRSAHQAVALAQRGGELWIAGGEFSSPSQSQFFHYRDLWVLELKDYTWKKISSSGGPSPRSGHRMVALKKLLVVFGGYHDNLRSYMYYSDIHVFNTETYQWVKVDVSSVPPSPRSGCVMVANPELNQIVLWGGYSRERLKKDCDKGQTHTDMFCLDCKPREPDSTGSKGKQLATASACSEREVLYWRWKPVKQSGTKPSVRCSCSVVAVGPSKALVFGGVCDVEEDEESLNGVFYNELYLLETDAAKWHIVTLRKAQDQKLKKCRRKQEALEGASNSQDDVDLSGSGSDNEVNMTAGETSTICMDVALSKPVDKRTTFDDGIFMVKLGNSATSDGAQSSISRPSTGFAESMLGAGLGPCGRMNSALAVRGGRLYLYGGMFEEGDKQMTLNDFYSLDVKKFDEWQTIVPLEADKMEWQDSESSSSGEEEEGNPGDVDMDDSDSSDSNEQTDDDGSEESDKDL